jgi:hypothetical protein
MSSLRDKYKGAQISANKEIVANTERLTGNREGRPGFHSLKEGQNVFRVCPPHDPKDPSLEPKCVVWIPLRIDEVKDNQKTGKKIVADRPVFNSKVHAGTEKDLVEEYTKAVAAKIAEECQDKDERQRKLNPITGWRDKKGWNPGIRYSTSYVLYAFQNAKLGRLEIMRPIKDRMEELNIAEEGSDPITTDVFSDPNNGISLILILGKDIKTGKNVTTVKKREFNPQKFKTWDEFITSERLTDAQLEEFDKQPSLKSIYRDSFKRSDFEKQLEGLQIFDERNGYNMFENEEFLKIVEELDALYPEAVAEVTEQTVKTEEAAEIPEEEAPKKVVKSAPSVPVKSVVKPGSKPAPVEEPETEVSGDKFDSMNREELKRYRKEKNYQFVITTAFSDDKIRELIREAEVEVESEEEIETVKNMKAYFVSKSKQAAETGEPDDTAILDTKPGALKPNKEFDEEVHEPEAEEQEEESDTKVNDTKAKIAAMRARMQKSK